ncbi:hypothetical protein [Vibrio campbellii]|uniref:hypothetical protein n=1 Tax=Vibrio campbellii TaxID=680 RepID=UPI0005EE2AE1|nr:hypothetical protein [Vibrio campbellii]
MNISIWKSRRNKNQLVASQSNGIHIYFDSFELETVEASLWLYQGSVLVACFEAKSDTLNELTKTAQRMFANGAQNHGVPLNDFRKQDEAPQVGADSSFVEA